MKTLIVPMAGKSSRFPGMRPKWMLTHPKTNRYMCLESIRGLNLDFFDQIYFIFLAAHETKYDFMSGFKVVLKEMGIEEKSKCLLLDSETNSQAQTVYEAIIQEDIEGFIFIKDSDGYFRCNLLDPVNQVAYEDLNNVRNINPASKSYIQIDDNANLTNIVEKHVISTSFCVWGYGFESSKDFIRFYLEVSKLDNRGYISDIIYLMLLNNVRFQSISTAEFKDWGTIEDWNRYKENFKCMFVDIDGTLITNSSSLFAPYTGTGKALRQNIDALNQLYLQGFTYTILTTSRAEDLRQLTVGELTQHGILYDHLLMGLPHSQRILINDFSESNSFPSCVAINLPRDSDNLQQYLN
jgi:hypothetical protein